ncbi:MAG: alpha-N-acetylglucosaminidase C-terminal domain-containing protein [Verrucomicrobia bacterium]|nr:alpha-N-acetylglucosaminidase C-terminal domain-containing protein [Verrucomicrobiota bacterium]
MRSIIPLCLIAALVSPALADSVAGARGVLARTLGPNAARSVTLTLDPSASETYRYQATGGKLAITGGSTAALCRGAYDYLRANKLGTVGWAGPRLRLSDRFPDAAETTGTSPFRIRHCYNVVTFGYTTPYWGWERWERELDWMAMHGYNMVMAPVATEAIALRVWKNMGLTDKEIAEAQTGPAHLPWQRMGNIRDMGSGLTESWHRDQIALQKKLLARMRELGIEPVIQGFAGFVPPGIKRLHPDVNLHVTHWNGGIPVSQRPVVMLPDSPLWARIGKAFITEWKKEFGDARYWLVDSFNELQLPQTDQPPAVMLARYGKSTYDTIRAADPDGVWVLQGWMFNYQRNIWNTETVKSLVESVPPNDLLVLDYANDYNPNWDDFGAFHGRSWVMGYVPNMGGKTAYTGKMDFYASQAAKTLASPAKGNLTGFTISGEGLENNEVLYELMSDTAWTTQPVHLDTWLPAYAANRYGSDDPVLADAWLALRRSVYSSFQDHPTFGWQAMNLGQGSVYRDPRFVDAINLFLSKAGEHGKQPNYRDDALEMAALALGLRAEEWFVAAREAHGNGDTETFLKLVDEGLALLLNADRLLESHSLLRLQAWIDHARGHIGSPAEKDDWERNARQIVTVWGPPVNDYSCRVWSGLIRDFYVPRLKAMTAAMAEGKPFNRHEWEARWVNGIGISPVERVADPAAQAAAWVKEAYQRQLPNTAAQGEIIGTWEPGLVTGEWKSVEWKITPEQLARLDGVRFQYTKGHHRLDIREASIVADGMVIATDRHDGQTGDFHRGNVYRFKLPKTIASNNTLVLRAGIRSLNGADSYGKVLILTR